MRGRNETPPLLGVCISLPLASLVREHTNRKPAHSWQASDEHKLVDSLHLMVCFSI